MVNITRPFGIALFVAALLAFIVLPVFNTYQITSQSLEEVSPNFAERHRTALVESLRDLQGESLGTKLGFYPKVKAAFRKAQEQQRSSLVLSSEVYDEAANQAVASLSGSGSGEPVSLTTESRQAAIESLPAEPADYREQADAYTSWMNDRQYENADKLREELATNLQKGVEEGYIGGLAVSSYEETNYLVALTRAAASGWVYRNRSLLFWLLFTLAVTGALLYIIPTHFRGPEGIDNDHIWFRSYQNRGLIGILLGIFLIGYYILLYFYPHYIVEWTALADPISQALLDKPADRWFMYGLLYTVAILVMGVRMIGKYRHSNYHKIRTYSVMFFQLAFAFLIPQILFLLNAPQDDPKNIWPLNYSFFFDYSIENHLQSGTLGIFLLVWGIVLAVVAVPLLTYFFGKRWYCSWVCGCGGLAETLGDPYRQLSDKSTESWQIERIIVHGVLLFAVVMTGLVLYTYFTGSDFGFSVNRYLALGAIWAVAGGLIGLHRKFYGYMPGVKVIRTAIILAASLSIILFWPLFFEGKTTMYVNSGGIRTLYGFAIGSIFAGVVGTGFYPLMGNRVWCRFGCPLAAYLGLVQRFKSRFRITTNGGQCISCGNCSTYCEMGIDVRAYAQRGQNIVRASCVGCGVCASVCPRGVLALENGPDTGTERVEEANW